MQIIELDCPPGVLRPGDLIAGVIANTGLPLREPVAKSFGNWTWDYSDLSSSQWNAVVTTIQERIVKLYESGNIRYGGWS